MLLDWCRAKTRSYEVSQTSAAILYSSLTQTNKAAAEPALTLSFPALVMFFFSVTAHLFALAREHSELLLQLEQWDGVLCPGAQFLSRRLRLRLPEPQQSQAKLWGGLQRSRVSTLNGCISTSSCVEVDVLKLIEIIREQSLTLRMKYWRLLSRCLIVSQIIKTPIKAVWTILSTTIAFQMSSLFILWYKHTNIFCLLSARDTWASKTPSFQQTFSRIFHLSPFMPSSSLFIFKCAFHVLQWGPCSDWWRCRSEDLSSNHSAQSVHFFMLHHHCTVNPRQHTPSCAQLCS